MKLRRCLEKPQGHQVPQQEQQGAVLRDMLGGSSEGPAMSECGLGKVCGTYGWVRYGVRYGGMVRTVGYGVRHGTAHRTPPYLSTVPL